MKNTNYLIGLQVFILLGVVFTTQAQTLRGAIHAINEGAPIPDATVMMFKDNCNSGPISRQSDSTGNFIFDKIPAGYYRCEISATGYQAKYFTEVMVLEGKEQVLEIDLEQGEARPAAHAVPSTQSDRRPLQLMGETPLLLDQTTRFSAMYFDISRLAAVCPGVAQIDDGANMMSVRGNSPAMLRWRMEGLDIVSPNHLPNAGTVNDVPAIASGGALILSNQMLDNSSMMTGAFPAGFGDAVAGVMDLHLRNGNNRQHEIALQAGLLGSGLAIEGPLRHKKDHSYLFNLRTSTLGSLHKLGISLGDEEINFQDLSFKFNLHGKYGGQYAVFGMLGLSKNIYQRKGIASEIRYDKERYDIDFHGSTHIIGGTGKWKTGIGDWFKAAFAYSAQNNDWLKPHPEISGLYNEDSRLEKHFSNSLEWQFSHRQNQFSAGSNTTWINFNGVILRIANRLPSTALFNNLVFEKDIAYFNAQFWLRWHWTSWNGRWSSQLGTQFHYNIVYQKIAPAPRGVLACQLAKKHKLAITAGLYKQDAPVWLQKAVYVNELKTFRPPYISSFQTGLKYTWTPAATWAISSEFFAQTTENLPTDSLNKLSLFNQPEYTANAAFFANSRARNCGLELSATRSLQHGWFLTANGTFVQIQFSNTRPGVS